MTNENPLSQEEFDFIYSKVPRLTVEIIVKNDLGEIYLTKRAINPCKGEWHLPGGTVRFGELVTNAVKRIAAKELGVSVEKTKQIGYIEYPSHFLNGLDSPVGLVFEVIKFTGKVKVNNEATEGNWYDALPINMHADQDVFLIEKGYLKK